MADLSEMTNKTIPADGSAPVVNARPSVPPDPTAEIARATGLNMGAAIPHVDTSQGDITPVSKPLMAGNIVVPPITVPPAATPVPPAQPAAPVSEPASIVEDPASVKSGEKTVALDPMTMGLAEEEARYRRVQAEKQAETMAQLDETLKAEEERYERMSQMAEEIRVESGVMTRDDRTRAYTESSNPSLDDLDLTPGYSEEDMDAEPEDGVSAATPESELSAEGGKEKAPDPGDDQYGEYIRNLPVGEMTNVDPEKAPARIIRSPKITTVKKQNKQTLGDQAFMNAITRFKKDNFGKADVCLVNSGFSASIVGTGVVDMQNLYMNVSRNTTVYDYELDQMQTVLKSVVGTNPKINPVTLSQMIHFRDYETLSFGHICATLDKVETVANCKECGSAFRLETDPQSLVLNEDEMYERRMRIQGAANIEDVSLMTTTRKIEGTNGIVVTLSHPSYSEYVRGVRCYQDKVSSMSQADAHRFESMLEMLYYIHLIELPSGVKTSNLYQNYIALGLLTDADFDAVNREINNMTKEIIVPKYGIRECRCPVCGAINKNIAYRNLLDLLFYHTTVSSFLNNPES